MKTTIVLLMSMVGCAGGGEWTSEPDPAPALEPVLRECESSVTGHISVTNGTTRIVEVLVNDLDYGPVDTHDSLETDLPPGPYVVDILYADDGAAACLPASVNVSTCSTQALMCPGAS